MRWILTGALLVACASVVVSRTYPGQPSMSLDPNAMLCHGPNVDLTWAGYVACQATIVEGTVLSVGPGSDRDRRSVTLKVARWLKPSQGAATTTLDIRSLGTDRGGALKIGGRYLLTVPKCSNEQSLAWEAHGIAQPRQAIVEATPESKVFEDRNPFCY